MRSILEQLSNKTAEARASSVQFAPVDPKQHLNNASVAYSNVFNRGAAPTANASNVFDINTGHQVELGSLNVDPSLLDSKLLNLAPGQEPVAAPTLG